MDNIAPSDKIKHVDIKNLKSEILAFVACSRYFKIVYKGYSGDGNITNKNTF
jgi:hypothetical protein